MADPIYLDFNATTPLDPSVLEEMVPWFTDQFWNAASSHWGGRIAGTAVDGARDRVAALIGARPGEIVWTSGATEANNLALKGVVESSPPNRRRVVTFATEHKAVLDAVAWIAEQGVPVTLLGVNRDGSLPLDALAAVMLGGDVAIVSVMAANNETGVLADLPAIAAVVHEGGALFHSDATQVVGRMPFDVTNAGVDLASMSAHKLYGPKGVGGLYVERHADVAPLIHGGGHERGRRSGTLNGPGVVGFGAAADRALESLEQELVRQGDLVATFVGTLCDEIPGVALTTDYPARLTNTVNLRIIGADAEAVMANAREVAVSSGSACTALVPAPSHVLRAMGLTDEEALECLRISVGRPTTEQDVITGAKSVAVAASRVRDLV